MCKTTLYETIKILFWLIIRLELQISSYKKLKGKIRRVPLLRGQSLQNVIVRKLFTF